MLSLNVALYVIGTATIIWSFIDHGALLSALIAIVWAALLFSLKKMNLGIPAAMSAAAFVLVASMVTILYFPDKGDKVDVSNATTSGQSAEEKAETPDPAGTIIVDGKNGVLSGGGAWSNISDIERDNGHGEAYLGDKAATATYSVEVTTDRSYRLWVKLSDDAQHFDGARNATITINGSQTVKYTHVSEDTKGWKWYDLGTITLSSGSNTIAFTKDSDTSAAYVMNQFKLVP